MELNRTRKWPYVLTAFWVVTLVALGGWWIVLVLRLSQALNEANLSWVSGHDRLLFMIQWEGLTFFVLLLLLSLSLFYVYFQDLKKTNALHAFFASLTHELKTPLASIRLQAEVLQEMMESSGDQKLGGLIQRLLQDAHKLEGELDKTLQLSRLERGGNLSLVSLDLERFIQGLIKKNRTLPMELSTQGHHFNVLADEFALNLIFRNLLDNTNIHTPAANKQVSMELSFEGAQTVLLTYRDNGSLFAGDVKKLGQLFYKFNSSKGSGIGLYLIKQLLRKMGGDLTIQQLSGLVFELRFQRAQGEDADAK